MIIFYILFAAAGFIVGLLVARASNVVGSMHIRENEQKLEYRLELATRPEDLATKSHITFKVLDERNKNIH